LNQIEFLEITKHCSITFELLQKMPDVPTGARMVAYQLHERFDGSGYPRQRRGAQIHPLARIAMVADMFVAMISPRPHRPPILPYKAMEFILHSTKLGKFDPDVVRGLLQTVGLFPIGSYVLLSDHRTARVIRAHRELFNRPVVEIQPNDGPPAEPEVVDLAAMPGLEIIRALPIPPQVLTTPPCAAAG
jgi:HD-GYP domain-containing protein (c-di-GMP phosphodiesterase class II)